MVEGVVPGRKEDGFGLDGQGAREVNSVVSTESVRFREISGVACERFVDADDSQLNRPGGRWLRVRGRIERDDSGSAFVTARHRTVAGWPFWGWGADDVEPEPRKTRTVTRTVTATAAAPSR